MKKAFLFAALICLVGCAVPVNVDVINQAVGADLETSVGEIFFQREFMNGQDNGMGNVFNGEAYKIELAVRSANAEKLVLDYSEFMKPVAGQFGGYVKDGDWLKKAAFDKTLEFDLRESKTVFYKNYEFEIEGINGGRIKYKRTK